MPACLDKLNLGSYSTHTLHSHDAIWPESNCYIDLWIEVLHQLGLEPAAALGFAARQDFEGDQFTFTKFNGFDLELLYGLTVQELAIYEAVELHVLRQISRRRLCLVEVDPYYLPDTGSAAYRLQHGKTVIGVNRLDPDRGYMEYFHNGGYFSLAGEDFAGVFRPIGNDHLVFRPYVEFTALEPARYGEGRLRELAACSFSRHWACRPASNPIRAFQAVAVDKLEMVGAGDSQAFHDFAFHNLRLLGANFGLLSHGLSWLGGVPERAVELCSAIAENAKAAQFQAARAVARRKYDTFPRFLDPAADAWDALFETVSTIGAA